MPLTVETKYRVKKTIKQRNPLTKDQLTPKIAKIKVLLSGNLPDLKKLKVGIKDTTKTKGKDLLTD